MSYTTTGLFSGAGGMELAAWAAGFEVRAMVEIDEWCRSVLEFHRDEYWKSAKIHADVRGCAFQHLERTDVIAGGFPCQPFSISGSRKGADDSRNLWPEFRRVIGELQPRAVILENVPAICNPYTVEQIIPARTKANGLARIRRRQISRPAYALTIIKDLSEMGYVCQWGIISARDAGAAHLRERWWLVGYASRTGYRELPTAVGRQRTGLRGKVEPGSEVLEHAESIGQQRPGQPFRLVDTTSHRYWQGNQSGNASGGLSQPRMVATNARLPSWLAQYRRPALINELPGCAQFEHEPERTIAQKRAHHKDAIKAYGNAIFIPTAYQIFRAVYEQLEAWDRAAVSIA